MKQRVIFDEIIEDLLVAPRPSIHHHYTLFVDGASRNNPGEAGAGVYVLKDGEVVIQQGYFLGIKTNNQAEYFAFLVGLFLMADYYQKGDTVRVVSDSLLLVMQLNNRYKVTNDVLKKLHALAQKMMRLYDAQVTHVLRIDNIHADAMANKGVDEKKVLPEAFIELLRDHTIMI